MTEEEKTIAQRIEELNREISHHYEDADMHVSLAALKVKQRLELQGKLDAQTRATITVTPEAVVDYMEIYHTSMLTGIRRRILREKCLQGVQFSGNGKYATDDGKAVMTVADNTILGFSETNPTGKKTDKEQ